MRANNMEEVTRIFFVRHGVTDQTGKLIYGHTKGIHLNDEGTRQVADLAKHMEPLSLDAIYTSPLERAVETAESIGHIHGLSPIVKEGLIEMDPGLWSNLTLEECSRREEWKSVQETPSIFCFPQGESFKDVIERMNHVVNTIVDNHRGQSIVITGHRDPIILMIAQYLSLDIDNFQQLPCEPASFSEVHFFNGKKQVQSINVLPMQRIWM